MYKRELEYDRDFRYDSNSNSNDSASERRRKRKSRWGGDEQEKVFIPGMPTIIPSNLTKEQEEIYIIQLQIESITRRILTGELGIPENPEERSPSPEPVYNSEGKRLNTREYRTKKKLEDERHNLIQRMFVLNTNYKPPQDYKPPQTKICEKVIIPQEEYPDINFVGLIIGPRGNTLKGMEKDSNAKIIIRGKGSVKEGKLARKDGGPMPGEDEPLHAFVTGPTHEAVASAVSRIKDVIRKGIELPENQNDLRRSQLRELALLNGTLRENEGPRCSNCGSNNHRSWQCPDKPNVTNNVICHNCGGAGHIARDCKERRGGGGDHHNSSNRTKIDEEYLSFMADLGEGPPPPPPSSMSTISSGGLPPPPPPPPANKPAKELNPAEIYAEQQRESKAKELERAAAASTSSAANGSSVSTSSAEVGADAWNHGNDAAWAGYMASQGYDPYAYAQMWWGAAGVGNESTNGTATTDATAAAYAAAYGTTGGMTTTEHWSQYAQWYASQTAAGNGTTNTPAVATATTSTTAAMYPPPPPPPSM